MDVGTERLEGRDVDHPDLIREWPLQTLTEELVERVQEGGQSFSRAGRCRDQGVTTGSDCLPAKPLRRRWLTESLVEPAGDDGMERRKRHRRNIAAGRVAGVTCWYSA
jgi:hypothetical protein